MSSKIFQQAKDNIEVIEGYPLGKMVQEKKPCKKKKIRKTKGRNK